MATQAAAKEFEQFGKEFMQKAQEELDGWIKYAYENPNVSVEQLKDGFFMELDVEMRTEGYSPETYAENDL